MRNLLITFLLLGLMSCSCGLEKPDEQAIPEARHKLYVDYYLRYLQSEKQLKVEASFREGIHIDSAKNIEPEGSVFLENIQLLPYRISSDNLRYQKEFNRVFEDEYNFKFVDDKEQSIINHPIQISSIDNFSIEENTGSKSTGFNITWEGDTLQENEELLVLLTDSKNKASSYIMEGPSSKKSCTFPTTRMDGLNTGKGFLYLVKKQKSFVEKEEMSIKTLAEFYSDKVDINITE